MSDSQTYLKLLSKIVHGGRIISDNEFEKLYALINNELSSIVNRSHFPATAEFVKDFNSLINSMESALLFPELHDWRVIFVEGQYINTSLGEISFLFDCDISELVNQRTYIPYYICNSDEPYIESVNYENRSVELSFSEMKALIDGAFENNIVLSRLVKFFRIHLPLKINNVCLVVGFMSRTALFQYASGAIYLSQKTHKYHKGIYLPSDTDDFEKQVVEYIESVPKMTFGIYAKYHCLCNKVISFLNNEIRKALEIRTALTNDITMLESDTEIFTNMRKSINAKIKDLKAIINEYNGVVSIIDPLFTSLADKFGDNAKGAAVDVKFTIDAILEELIDCVEYNDFNAAEKCLETLGKYGYAKKELAAKYVYCSKNDDTADVVFDIKTYAEAKMAVGISNLDALPLDEVIQYNKLIKNPKNGREMYLLAREWENKNIIQYTGLLKSSFEKGYEPAGRRLVKMSETNKKINVFSLACHLLPEACVKIAEEDVDRFDERKRLSVTNKELVYYKLAASKGYLPAIAKIVDLVYEDRFASLFQIVGNDAKFDTMRSNGKVIMGLCQYLKSHNYNSMHYQEIYGIVVFCLNKNLSEAMQTLSGINTPAANYCKGVMYEFGTGTARDIQQAINHYQKATGVKKAQYALERAIGKRGEEQIEKKSEDNYSENKSYSADVSSDYQGDSWCFITTAACTALQGADNCEELNILRDFRDKHINDTANGRELVLEYYRIAPMIIDKINSESDPASIYKSLWTYYIEPSCREIKKSNYRVAKEIYIKMVISLCVRFQVKLSDNIMYKYSNKLTM